MNRAKKVRRNAKRLQDPREIAAVARELGSGVAVNIYRSTVLGFLKARGIVKEEPKKKAPVVIAQDE